MQRHIFNSDQGPAGNMAGRSGALLAIAGLLLLSACGSSKDVTDKNLAEPPFKDGIPPTLTEVTIRESTKTAKPVGTVKPGKVARVDLVATEALMKPLVTINGVQAEVIGKVNKWYAVREMTAADTLDEMVTFTIVYQDISGELGQPVSQTTDGSALLYCDENCPEPVGSLAGDWRLDGVGAAGVGPAEGDVSWWAANEDTVAARDCWYDDVYRFGSGGSFNQILGDETWLEPFQGVPSETCGAPVAPHDGSTTGTWEYNELAGTLTITGRGLHLGLAKVVNGETLNAPGDAPDSIVYNVFQLDGDMMTVTIEANPGEWWLFRFVRAPVSPLAGKWKLDGEGAAGVGPAEGDTSWWAANADTLVTRDCWFDDIYEFGTDGSFRNILGDETWLEPFQVGSETCGAPVAPHDGSNPAIYQYDEEASTLKLTGVGAHIGLPRTVNGADLAAPSEAPESVTYNVFALDGDSLTVTIQSGDGNWWQYRLVRVSTSPLVGNWMLDGEGAAGVGPAEGDTSWWAANADTLVTRDCWFDDVYHFGDDGSFRNFLEGETWLEPFQVGSETCGAPVAPHDGSNPASFQYDADAGTLTLTGVGAHIGLPRTVNGADLSAPSEAPESVTYNVFALDGDTLTLTIQAGDGNWWQYRLARVPATAAVAGNWVLDGEGAAGVGPAEGDTSWWAANADTLVTRDCWFDDIYEFGADGSFRNVLGDETWLEPFQAGSETCGAPVAPHDGSNPAIFQYDPDAGTLKVTGVGAHLGLPRTVNGADLSVPADAPESVTYNVFALDGDTMTLTIQSGDGNWWQYRLARISNSPLVGNWLLDGEGAAGVGPAEGDTSWWAANADTLVTRDCWFDDVFHFGDDGSFRNFQDGETWLEPFQVGSETCGAPIAPHDGSNPATFQYDADGGTVTLIGVGAHLGLPRTVNGADLSAPSGAPASVTYNVFALEDGVMTVTIQSGDGNWWLYRFAKD